MLIRKISIFITIFAIVGASTTACDFSENTRRRVVSEYNYSFEPASILQSIFEEEQNVFSEVNINSEPSIIESQSVLWDQSDYLQLVDAFHEYVWNESVDTWSLNYMSLSLSCNQIGKGFLSASFSYFQETPARDEGSEIEHQIDIYPGRRLINAWEFAYESRLFRGRNVTISTAVLSANDALMIAENAGGLQERLSLNNKCEISVILAPNSVNNLEWKVLYSPQAFSITLDSVSGKPVK